jgi:tetratricopeptide (TPR) repeat protein
MNRFAARLAIGAAVAVGTAGAFYAGIAYASDPRLDQAIDNCTKAIALLEAASNDGAKHSQNFHGYRKKAIGELKEAIKNVEKAKKFDDKTPAPAASAPQQ